MGDTWTAPQLPNTLILRFCKPEKDGLPQEAVPDTSHNHTPGKPDAHTTAVYIQDMQQVHGTYM